MRNSSKLLSEDDMPPNSDIMPRAATEEATRAAVANSVNAYILRLPPTTHGQGDHGFMSMVVGLDKQHGVAAYLGDGHNRWPAAHRFDAAVLYRLIIEQKPTQKVFHAVAEEGVPFKQIAEAIGKGTGMPIVAKDGKEAEEHFGWFLHFAGIDCAASSAKTRQAVGWEPTHPTLMEDINAGYYF